jgi:hypothetical protein
MGKGCSNSRGAALNVMMTAACDAQLRYQKRVRSVEAVR